MQLATQQQTSTTLAVSGRVDALNAPELRARLTELLAEPPVQLLVDLSEVEFIDSAGLAALVRGLKVAREGGGEVQLRRPRSVNAFRVFELTKFDSVFTMHPASPSSLA